MQTIAEVQAAHLIAVYENWLADQGRPFPCIPPENLLRDSRILTDLQRTWLEAFITIWNAEAFAADVICLPRGTTSESLKILDLLAVVTQPLSTSQIAHRTGLDVGVVRQQMPLLVRHGQVETCIGSGPTRFAAAKAAVQS